MSETTKVRPKMDAEVFLSTYRKDREMEDTVKAIKADWKGFRESASGAGLDLIAFKATLNILKLEPRRAKEVLGNLLLYLRFLGQDLFDQGDLFESNSSLESLTKKVRDDQANWEAERNGRKAGLSGETPVDANPCEVGSDAFARWRTAWYEGEEERKAAERAKADKEDNPDEGGGEDT